MSSQSILQQIPAAEADFLKIRAVNVPEMVAGQSLKEGGGLKGQANDFFDLSADGHCCNHHSSSCVGIGEVRCKIAVKLPRAAAAKTFLFWGCRIRAEDNRGTSALPML
jgi:hypothetical protein